MTSCHREIDILVVGEPGSESAAFVKAALEERINSAVLVWSSMLSTSLRIENQLFFLGAGLFPRRSV